MENKGKLLGECTTEGCERKARYMPWPEAKVLGNDASFRCPQCCNAIHEYALIVQQNSDKAPKRENSMEALHKTLSQPYNKD